MLSNEGNNSNEVGMISQIPKLKYDIEFLYNAKLTAKSNGEMIFNTKTWVLDIFVQIKIRCPQRYGQNSLFLKCKVHKRTICLKTICASVLLIDSIHWIS